MIASKVLSDALCVLLAAVASLAAVPALASGELPVDAEVVVAPLLKAEWNQGRHYNLMCPAAPATASCPDNRMYAGCVAVAAAMILDYYRWPLQGTGTSQVYEQDLTGDDAVGLRARFDWPYDWEAINPSYGHVVGARSSLAVGQLLADIGAVLGMNYGVSGSSSETEKIPEILERHFFFSAAGLRNVEYPYDESELAAAREQLVAGHPIACSGPAGASGTGHSYVCDGWARTAAGGDLFHFNFGWGGGSNGWYPLESVFTRAKPGEKDQSWPVSAMHLGVFPSKAAQFANLPPSIGSSVTLDWAYASCWEQGIVSQTLERQVRVPVEVNRMLSGNDWWIQKNGGFGWDLEEGMPVGRIGSYQGYYGQSAYWPGWGSATIGTETPVQVSSGTSLTLRYLARKFPSGIRLCLCKAVPDTQMGYGYTVYPPGVWNPIVVCELPGGTSSSLMERTVAIDGATLVKAFGAFEPEAHFALLFEDDGATTSYSAETEVFRLESFAVTGSTLDWQTVETRTLDAASRQAGFANLPTGSCRFRLSANHGDGGSPAATLERIVVAGTLPSARVASVRGRSVTFEVSGISDFSCSFEKQSNALAGTFARSGSNVIYSFKNEVAALGTHWLTLYVRNAAGEVVAKATHITNPPTDHPLLADFEPDYSTAVERARREKKLVFIIVSGEPDGRKFKNIAGMLSSNEVLQAVSDKFVVTEAITTTSAGSALGQRFWRAQPNSPTQTTGAKYQPEINAYAIVIDPNRPDRPYPCDTLPASYFNDSSRWNYFNSQLDLTNLGYDFYAAQQTKDIARFLGQTGFAVTDAPALDVEGETPFAPVPGQKAFFVPNSWLVSAGLVKAGEGASAASAALSAVQPNGRTGWESFVAGLDPKDAKRDFVVTIELIDGKPVIRWSPDLTGTPEGAVRPRRYVVQGKGALNESWRLADYSAHRFFRVTVDMGDY